MLTKKSITNRLNRAYNFSDETCGVEESSLSLPVADYVPFRELVPQAEQLHASCLTIQFFDDDVWSQRFGKEGFFDFVFRLIAGIADLVGRLFRTFKLVYRSFQHLARTELQDYAERHLGTMVRIKNINYQETSQLQVPLPKGLNTTYVDVTQKILACLQLCDMKSRSKSFAVTAKNLATKIGSSIPTNDSVAVLFEQTDQIQQINNRFTQYDKCFDKSNANQAEFGKLFNSSDEFQLEYSLLNDNAQYMYDIHNVHKSLDECNASLQLAVQYAKARKSSGNTLTTIGKEELISLSTACLFMAKTFDTYGLSIQDFHRVEHNYVEVMKTIQRAFKL